MSLNYDREIYYDRLKNKYLYRLKYMEKENRKIIHAYSDAESE